jgi:hypothetical protein
MQKLRLDSLTVDSFSTTTGAMEVRGTVAGYSAQCTVRDCPVSYGGTCWITCFETCPCTDGPACG